MRLVIGKSIYAPSPRVNFSYVQLSRIMHIEVSSIITVTYSVRKSGANVCSPPIAEIQSATLPSLGETQAAASSSANVARSIEKPSVFAGVPRQSGSMVSAGEVCILAAGSSRRALVKSGSA
jgi:hypothetical protein